MKAILVWLGMVLWYLPAAGQSIAGTYLDEETGEMLQVSLDNGGFVRYASSSKPTWFGMDVLSMKNVLCEYSDGDILDSVPVIKAKFATSATIYELKYHHYEWLGLIVEDGKRTQRFSLMTQRTDIRPDKFQILLNRMAGVYIDEETKEGLQLILKGDSIEVLYQTTKGKWTQLKIIANDRNNMIYVEFNDKSKYKLNLYPGGESGFGPDVIECVSVSGKKQVFIIINSTVNPMVPVEWVLPRN